jgi:hypothetical protein
MSWTLRGPQLDHTIIIEGLYDMSSGGRRQRSECDLRWLIWFTRGMPLFKYPATSLRDGRSIVEERETEKAYCTRTLRAQVPRLLSDVPRTCVHLGSQRRQGHGQVTPRSFTTTYACLTFLRHDVLSQAISTYYVLTIQPSAVTLQDFRVSYMNRENRFYRMNQYSWEVYTSQTTRGTIKGILTRCNMPSRSQGAGFLLRKNQEEVNVWQTR